MATSNGKPIPKNLFVSLSQWIPNLLLEELKNEYLTFSKSFKNLQAGLNLTILNKSDDSSSINEEIVNEE